MVEQSRRDPVDEGWVPRGTPYDRLGTERRRCPSCDDETVQDGFRIMMGRHGGMGAPFFVAPFMKRKSTKGKVGKRSEWAMCRGCGSLLPIDLAASEVAESSGFALGFLKAPTQRST